MEYFNKKIELKNKREIKVDSLPFYKVMPMMAQAMNTIYHIDCDEYTVKIPKEYGSGRIFGINFNNGLGIICYDCTFSSPMRFIFNSDEPDPVKIIFCNSGSYNHKIGENEKTKIEALKGIIAASPKSALHNLDFKANKKIELVSLEINREQFFKKIYCEIPSLPLDIQALLKDVKAEHEFVYIGNFSLEMSQIIKEIIDNTNTGLVRKLFLEAKALSIFTTQIDQYSDDLNSPNHQLLLRRSEVDQIMKAAQIFKDELKKPPTISTLSKRVGINSNKLQIGFKALYNSTINEYLNQLRLQTAEQLLMHSDLNIGEIVTAIGLSNQSYFSRLFKKEYGMNPKSFQKKRRDFAVESIGTEIRSDGSREIVGDKADGTGDGEMEDSKSRKAILKSDMDEIIEGAKKRSADGDGNGIL